MNRSLLIVAGVFVVACGGSGGGDTDSNCTSLAQCTTPGTNVTSITSATGENPTGSATDATDTGGDPPSCAACGDDQVCIAGACTAVPDQCPCPLETYCELVTSKCVIGCTKDAECDAGRICDPIKRECFPGCREDSECGAGEICEGLTCIAGCRNDGDCGAMQICDGIVCRQGCQTDGECPQGQVCDATVCRVGCTSEADCPGAGEICDIAKKVCRAGCQVNADCPLEQVCDPQALSCVAGCDSNAKCGAGNICKGGQCTAGCADDSGCSKGQICEADKCVSGCNSQDGCDLGQYCFEKQCVPGCGPPGGDGVEGMAERCPLGQACYPSGCAALQKDCKTFTCQPECWGLPCSSSPEKTYECIVYSLLPGWCMLQCEVDADCPAGKICQQHAIEPGDPFHADVGYCRKPCNSDAACKYIWSDMNLEDCKCEFGGPLNGKCSFNGEQCSHQNGQAP
ncbi:MAG: hypothetical protein H0T76_15225 [Nannocystis sp.]|nr:hypothetical protein [Nannocystis sp.]MBA3547833.1 hypothetical protein [Nannocystis sp.]